MVVSKPVNIYLFRGVAELIPYEDKWKFINQSTYLFRAGGGFEDKWKFKNQSTYLFRGGGGFEDKWKGHKPFNIFVQTGWRG